MDQKTNISIRSAQLREQNAMASVCGAAWFNEDLFGRVMHPRRHHHPNDVNLYWLRHLRELWFNKRSQILVAVASDESGQEHIAGVAVWSRQGNGGSNRSWGLLHHLYQRLIRIYNAVHSIVYPNRAADPSKFSLLQAAYPYFSYHFSTPQSKLEHYSLELLGVSPPYQGRGIGTKLVHWGIDAADKEGVCATVTSSEGNERFYQHAGFDDIVGWATEGEGNPLQKDQVKGGAILFHWAKGEEANARSSIWKENIKAE